LLSLSDFKNRVAICGRVHGRDASQNKQEQKHGKVGSLPVFFFISRYTLDIIVKGGSMMAGTTRAKHYMQELSEEEAQDMDIILDEESAMRELDLDAIIERDEQEAREMEDYEREENEEAISEIWRQGEEAENTRYFLNEPSDLHDSYNDDEVDEDWEENEEDFEDEELDR
jgi:vacuolar-type H+-ATPase subunit I/STV1